MATLQVRGADYSVSRQKAFDDATKMQAVVNDECAKSGKEAPPYLLHELIGKGSYGRVYKAKDLKSTEMVAVKIIDIEGSDTADPKHADTYSEFLKEINALKLLREGGAKNVNYILDALPVGHSMWMITEYCAGGSVATLMRPTAPGGLQEKWIIPILREVAEAIYWVHKQGIIHRDIKCANVLVTEAGGVQLCDFGVAGVIETKFDKRSTFIGTPNWMAPELFDQSTSYGTEVDIWAFGSMVFEIASGLPPNVVAGVTVSQLGSYLKQHTPRLEGSKYSHQLKDLVAFCLADDPSQRPPIEQVQHHPYIFGTSNAYPTDTLANLVKGYKLWEAQGGTRRSLFAPGGAQGPMLDHLSSSMAMANDEWNFSTTVDFDRSVLANPDSQAAVFDVYGTQVDYETGSNAGGPGGLGGPGGPGGPGDPSGPGAPGGARFGGSFGGGNDSAFSDGATPRPARMKGRRRQPPPRLPAVKVPLEKVFDPNTITNYDENSREYYGLPPPPPTASGNGTTNSDLPLRDDSLHSTLRESLIDLDASFDLSDTSKFADMETIRAGPSGPRLSVDYDASGDEGSEYNRPPLSDPADLPNNRRTQEWKFPTMPPPASANPEVFRFPFNDNGERSAMATPSGSSRGSQSNNNSNNNSISLSRPAVLVHHHTEPVGLSLQQGYDQSVPSTDDGANRMSMSSLIDLDMSMPDPIPEMMTRPSTANSDAPSISGSDYGMANPFDLEKHASIYVPSSSRTREPSIYVSDDSEYANMVAATIPGDDAAEQQQQQLNQQHYHQQYHQQHDSSASYGSSAGLGLQGVGGPGRVPPSVNINGLQTSSGMMMGDPDDESDGAQFSDYDSQQNMQGAYQSDGDLDNFLLHANADIEAIVTGFSNPRFNWRNNSSMSGSSLGQRMSRGNGSSASASGSGSGSGSGQGLRGMRQNMDDNHHATNASINGNGTRRGHGNNNSSSSSRESNNTSIIHYVDETNPNDGYTSGDVSGEDGGLYDESVALPPLPGPPSPHVMQGLGSREEVRDEMKRLLDSFKQHLSFTNTYVSGLSVRHAGGSVLRQDAQIEE